MLRAYMHGFFVDNRLWAKAKALVEPLGYDTYRQQQVAKKMEEDRASRISIVKRLPRVGGCWLLGWPGEQACGAACL
jgi:ribosome biogenesis protein ENP2